MTKLPGLLPISLLMFATVFTAWLGILGPVNLAALKEWQTLLGAGAVIGAASIAYFAATQGCYRAAGRKG